MDIARTRVLIVDDDELLVAPLRQSLRASALDVHVEVTATRAIEEVRSRLYDLVIVGDSISDTDGLTLLGELRAMNASLALILLSTRIDNALTVRAGERDALCLQKPVEPAMLLTAIRQHMAARRRVTPHSGAVAAELLESVTATSAKNEFGRVLDTVLRKGPVVITKRQERRAVLVSIEDYADMVRPSRPELDLLTHEFDELLDRMQSRAARQGAESLFSMGSDELGEAAGNHAKER